MPLFTKDSVVVDAHLWLKNGDHPKDYVGDVTGTENGILKTISAEERKQNGWEGSFVRYFRHPDISGASVCEKCNNTFTEHGWIDQDATGITVCPGNVVASKDTGETLVVPSQEFAHTYAPTFNAIFIPK